MPSLGRRGISATSYTQVMTREYNEQDVLRYTSNGCCHVNRSENDDENMLGTYNSRDERCTSVCSNGDSNLQHVLENGDCLQGDEAGATYRTTRHCHRQTDNSIRNKTAHRQLLRVTVLCFLFMIAESIGGVLSNSIALFTDVLHLGSDFINFAVCLLAQWLSNKSPTPKMSYGYHRAEILGALFSVVIIWIVSGVLCYIAGDRIIHGHYMDVKPDEMVVTAALGLFFNLVMGFALHSQVCGGAAHSHSPLGPSHTHSEDTLESSCSTNDEETGLCQKAAADKDKTSSDRKYRNINVRAAFIHVIGDTIQSMGVLLAAIIIKFAPNQTYRLADPICTFIFSLVVLATTTVVLRDVMTIVMEGVPRDVSLESLKNELAALDGVITVHSLHIWAITLDRNALSVHLAIGVPRDVSLESLKNELAALDGVITVHSLHIWAITLDRNALSVHLAIDTQYTHEQVLTSASDLIQDKHHIHISAIQVELYNEVMKTCDQCLQLN